MIDAVTKPKTKVKTKTERPRLHKVILVNDDTPELTWSNPQSGRYTAQQVIESPVGPLSFERGWASIDARRALKAQPIAAQNAMAT